MPKISYALPKYSISMIKLVSEVKRGFEKLDSIIGKIKTNSTTHKGTTRQVSEPQILETPMNRFSAELGCKYETFLKTDSESFCVEMYKFSEIAIADIRKMFFNIFEQTCNATGNSFNTSNRDFWDTYIEMLETIEMRFDADGNHNIELIGLNSRNPPSEEQESIINETIERRRIQFYAQKRTRRLS